MNLDELRAQEPSNPAFWRRFYEAAGSEIFGDDPFPFLNLGYLGVGEPAPHDDPEIADRLSERLYDLVLTDAGPVSGNVLEVGCGRGGGCARIARTSSDVRVVGVDRSRSLVEWCCAAHADRPNLAFRHGDALDLPFPPDSVDLLVNVESSHCYPSRPAFFGEVSRVLVSGGRFAYADLVFNEHVDRTPAAIGAQLAKAGLQVAVAEDILDGVLASRRATSRSEAFQARLARILPRRQAAETFSQLYFLEGSSGYARMVDGALGYWRWVAVKP